LIVDDAPPIRELVRAFLRNDGFDVQEAAAGREDRTLIESLFDVYAFLIDC
jgi:two-component system OmpR family response regulator